MPGKGPRTDHEGLSSRPLLNKISEVPICRVDGLRLAASASLPMFLLVLIHRIHAKDTP